jgi:hypothetical protein
MKIAKIFNSALVLCFVTPALAGQPEQGDLFWWEMGVLLNVQSQLAACNELYPTLIQQNESAYAASVFVNPVYDALLQKYPQDVPQDAKLNELFAIALKGRIAYKAVLPDVQHRLCSEFPKQLEERTQIAFGMSSTEIKRYLLERRKSIGKYSTIHLA